MKKKDFPIAVLEDMNNIKKEIIEEIKIVPEKGTLLKFIDKDPDSSFHFTIIEFTKEKETFRYTIIKNPVNRNIIEDRQESCNFQELAKNFQVWKQLISSYNEIEFFKGDAILNSYIQEFFDDYKILENDADTKPFDLKRQISIDNYLNKVLKFLEESKTQNPTLDYEKITAQAEYLKGNQTSLSKNETIKALAKLWGLAREKGIPFLKSVLFDFAKELIIEIGKKALLS